MLPEVRDLDLGAAGTQPLQLNWSYDQNDCHFIFQHNLMRCTVFENISVFSYNSL